MCASDRRGLPLSTASTTAAECYREGVDLLLSAWPGADMRLEKAVAIDPDFALAHAALARLHAIHAEPTAARTAATLAVEKAARRGDERERSHVEAVSLAVNGRSAEALRHALAHVERWPRDALVLSLPLGAFGLLAFSGMANHDQARVDLCERHAAQYDGDDWWFLTYRGWAHAENGNAGRGRALTERALALRPANANAAHALSHALHEAGAGEEAEAFIADWLPGYDRAGVLHGHIAWHAALSALERGDPERALSHYAAHVQPSASVGLPLNVVTDGASFLWRLQAYGHEAPTALWREVDAYAAPHFPEAGFAFADVHMALIAAATGDAASVERRTTTLLTLVEAGRLPAGPVVPAVCRAAQAFVQGDYTESARVLEPVAAEVVRIGGSGAQREIVEDTLIVALMRSGQDAKAHALLDRRLHRRPSARDARWRGLAA